MTTVEFAQMVQIMRRDQLHWHQHMTHAAAMKANYSERQVDKAVEKILADAPVDEPDAVTVCQAK